MELAIFKNDNFGEVRAVIENNEPWFIAKDVCTVLDIKNSRDALSYLESEDKGVATTDTLGGKQEMTIVSESGLYSLVFKSRKSEAKAFQKWITKEVIPSIRKTGGYLMSRPDETPEEIMARALVVAQDTLSRTKRQLANKTLALEETKPKAEFFDAVTGSSTVCDIGTVAKVLNMGVGRNKIFEILRDKGVLQRNNQPYQKYIDNGCFRLIESSYNKPNGDCQVYFKTVVFQKGVDYIRQVLHSEMCENVA